MTFANPFPVFNKDARTKAAEEQESDLQVHGNVQPERAGPGLEARTARTATSTRRSKGYKELAKLVNEAYQANPAR